MILRMYLSFTSSKLHTVLRWFGLFGLRFVDLLKGMRIRVISHYFWVQGYCGLTFFSLRNRQRPLLKPSHHVFVMKAKALTAKLQFPWFTLHVPQLKPCGLTLTFVALSPFFTVDIMADVQFKMLVGSHSVQKCFFPVNVLKQRITKHTATNSATRRRLQTNAHVETVEKAALLLNDCT